MCEITVLHLFTSELFNLVFLTFDLVCIRAVGRSENPEVPVLFGGHNLLPLIEIGLTDLLCHGTTGTPRNDRPVQFLQKIKIGNIF